MTKFFVGLYNYFERHKVLFYLSLSVCILFMALFAAQVRFEENVTSFFPDTKDSQNAINVFENLKIKDKIMIMLSGKDGVADADSLIEAAETIKQDLQQQAEGTLIKEIFSKADENLINSVGDFCLRQPAPVPFRRGLPTAGHLAYRRKHCRPDAEELFQPDISGRIRLEELHYAGPVGTGQPDAETPARLPVGS